MIKNKDHNIPRLYDNVVKKLLKPGKVLFIVGPRRAGKTTFLKQFIAKEFKDKKVLYAQGDVSTEQDWLSSRDLTILRKFLTNVDVLAIDEVHMVPNVGAALKIIVDNFPNLYILATGSASLDIVYKVGEPLVGRKFTLLFLPFALVELYKAGVLDVRDIEYQLEDFLVYGFYPEVFLESSKFVKEHLLLELVNSYLLKDILYFKKIKNPLLISKLLKLLAYQVGQLVSFRELSNELGVSVPTVQEYIEVLKQMFVIFEIPSYSTNKRNELKKSKKFYFYDNGLRNAVIGDFNDFKIRPDKGALWENFLMAERYKLYALQGKRPNFYFWRTRFGQEVDLVEAGGNYQILAYEFKLSKDKPSRGAYKFVKEYPSVGEVNVVNRDNFWEFMEIKVFKR